MNDVECRLLYWDNKRTNYLVTEYGDIYNILTWKRLSPCRSSSDRLQVCLSIDKRCITTSVHKIVYIAFYGNYDSTLTINHIDEDYENNYYKNLEQLSREDNSREYIKHHGTPIKKIF